MGRVCLARDGDESLLNQRIGRIFCDHSMLIPEYLFRSLQTSRFRQHAHAHCEGTKVQHLFWSHLGRYFIRVPPLQIQQEVVEKCKEVDAAIVDLADRYAAAQVNSAKLLNAAVGVVFQ